MADITDLCLDAGCLEPTTLLSLLRCKEPALVENAARAVGNIFAETFSGTEQMLELDALTLLTNIFVDGEAGCQRQAAKAIGNLCCYGSATHRDQLISSGALQQYCAALERPDDALAALVLTGLIGLVQAAEKDDRDADPEDECREKPLCLKLDKIGILGQIQKLLERKVIDECLRRQALELCIVVGFYTLEEDLIIQNGKVFTPAKIVQELKSEDLVTQAVAARAACCMLSRARYAGAARLQNVSDAMVAAGLFAPLSIALDESNCYDVQHEAARVFANLAYVKEHIMTAFMEYGVISKLVALLAKKSAAAEQAAIALGNIASHDIKSRNAVLYHGAVRALLPHLHPKSPLKQLRTFVWTCSEFCKPHSIRGSAPIERLSPALPSLRDLLAVEDERVLKRACDVIKYLMYKSEAAIDAVQAEPGLMVRLVMLLGHEAVAVQEAALRALVNMLGGTDAQAYRCLATGCLEDVARLLQCSEPALVEHAARAARNIFCQSYPLIERALDKKILTLLQHILAHEEHHCQLRAAEAITALCNMASAAQRERIVSSGMLQRCSTLLDSTAAAEARDGVDELSVSLTEQVCRIIQYMMHESVTNKNVVQAVPGLTARLVALLGHEAAKVQEAALDATINMLAGTETQVDHCLNAGFLNYIKQLLQCSKRPLVEGAAWAARHILKGTHSQIELALNKDILSPLLDILTDGDPQCQVQAAEAICNVCNNGSAAQCARVVSSGVLVSCTAALERIAVKEAREGADELSTTVTVHICRALQGIFYAQSEHKATAEVIPELTTWLLALLDHAAVVVRKAALWAVINILASTETQVERCLDPVISLLQCSEPSLVEPAGRATRNIVAHMHFIQRALDRDILTPLQNILIDGKLNCKVQAAWAIADICMNGSAAQRARVVSSGVLQRCSAALGSAAAAEARNGVSKLTVKLIQQVCRILTNIMKESSERIDAVQAVPGLTARLVSLLGHEEAAVQEDALLIGLDMLGGTASQADCFLAAGCLEHAARLLQRSEPALVEGALLMVVITFTRKHTIHRALEKDILTPLTDILANGELKWQEQAVVAVTGLCRLGSATQRSQLASSDALPPYCALLSRPDAAVLGNVLDGVGMLLQEDDPSFDGEALRSQMRELGVFDQIERLSEHENKKIKKKARYIGMTKEERIAFQQEERQLKRKMRRLFCWKRNAISE